MAVVDKAGRLVRFTIRPGNAAEAPELTTLLDGVLTGELIADKAYDSDPIRLALASGGIVATIPTRVSRRVRYWYDIGTTRCNTVPGTLSRTTSATSSSSGPSLPGTTSWPRTTALWSIWPPGSSRPAPHAGLRKLRSTSQATNSRRTTLSWPCHWPLRHESCSFRRLQNGLFSLSVHRPKLSPNRYWLINRGNDVFAQASALLF